MGEGKSKTQLRITIPIVSVIVAILALAANVFYSRLINRPYLGLSADSIREVSDYDASTHSGALRIQLALKNYGNLPTEFTATVLNWPGAVEPFQNKESFVMPTQGMLLSWDLTFPQSISSVCDLPDPTVEVQYDNHTLVIQSKWIPDPSVSSSSTIGGPFYAVRLHCNGTSTQREGQIWFIENSN